MPAMEIVNPRIESRAIRFVTPDVALTDGVCTYRDGNGIAPATALLLVLKKEGGQWKIASIRLLASR
jgi:hypothetical protein